MPQDLRGHNDVCIDEDTVSQGERWVVHGNAAKCGHSQEGNPEVPSLVPGSPASQQLASLVYRTLAERIELHSFFKKVEYIGQLGLPQWVSG